MSCNKAIEVFRFVPGYEGYEVSDFGRVASHWGIGDRGKGAGSGAAAVLVRKRRVLAPALASSGYLTVRLRRSTRKYATLSVHRLVILAFVGPCPEGMEVRHLDGDRRNNRLSNLAYGTRQVNALEKHEHGTMQCGDRHYLAKFTEADVLEIRRLRATGMIYREIAARFDSDAASVCAICKRRAWKHI